MRQFFKRSALLVTLFICSWAAQAASVTVITSYPKEITEIYKKAFEKRYPDTKLEILNKNHSAALAYIKENSIGQRPDVFWASAPDAFKVMARERLLERAPEVMNKAIPAQIGTYPMNDPDGMYYGQALSGYGIMWNTRYMKAHQLPLPGDWSDLVKPVYFGHVVMSSPSRSGTTHLTVETILQGEGWNKGWEQLLQIAGNSAAITERSFGVPEGVNSGQFGIGLVIDFFGLAGKYSGFPVEFIYPKVTTVVPASIALVAGARNPADAKKFIAFALSTEGQELLLDPKVSRIPALAYEQLRAKLPQGYPNIFEVARKSAVKFDSDLAEKRYYVVTSMFDQVVTFRLKELQAASKAIHEAAARLAAHPNAQASAMLQQARELAFTPVVDASMLKKPAFLDLFTKTVSKKSMGEFNSELLGGLEGQWSAKAKENYMKAAELAQAAGALAK